MTALEPFRAVRVEVIRELGLAAAEQDVEAAGVMLELLRKLDDAISLLTRRTPTVLTPEE